MASFDSSLTEADCMAQGACDATGTMGHDYSALGGFIGMSPDGAQQSSCCPTLPPTHPVGVEDLYLFSPRLLGHSVSMGLVGLHARVADPYTPMLLYMCIHTIHWR